MEQIKDLNTYKDKIRRILITKEQIDERIKEAAKRLDRLYDGRPLLLIGILKGSFVFLADLCRALTVPSEIGFLGAKSYYNGTVSSGTVKIFLDVEQDISKYHVVIVEDVLDTGRTLSRVAALLKERSPLSFTVITLLDKPALRVVPFEADITLFTIPDVFVIGYGLDCAEYYRNLPYIAEYGECPMSE